MFFHQHHTFSDSDKTKKRAPGFTPNARRLLLISTLDSRFQIEDFNPESGIWNLESQSIPLKSSVFFNHSETVVFSAEVDAVLNSAFDADTCAF
jgi:hypothetical protein